jgi:hypothetical protein
MHLKGDRINFGAGFDLVANRILCSYRELNFTFRQGLNILLITLMLGCETSSMTLREERRLRVFENRVMRSIFGPKRDEVTKEWRKLHNEER